MSFEKYRNYFIAWVSLEGHLVLFRLAHRQWCVSKTGFIPRIPFIGVPKQLLIHKNELSAHHMFSMIVDFRKTRLTMLQSKKNVTELYLYSHCA